MRSAGAARVSFEPTEHEALKTVTLRLPPSDIEWVDSHVKGKLSISRVVSWAIGLAREYKDALGSFKDQIDAIGKAEGMTTGAVVRHVFELGLAAYKKGKR
jgi:hypothetical protein